MAVFLKRNDVGDVISFNCENEDGSYVNLTGATVKFFMGKKNKLITMGDAVIKNAATGLVEYTLTDSDTLYSGNFPAEFEVTFGNGNVKTFPRIGYLQVNIESNLDNGKSTLVADTIATRVSDIQAFKEDITFQADRAEENANKVTLFESRINAIIVQSGDNTEVADARQTAMGGNHATLRDHLQSIGAMFGTTTSGGTNLYNLTAAGYTKGAYTEGMIVRIKPHINSTGSSRLNINGLGSILLKKANGADFTNLKTTGVYTFVYSSGNFILQGEGGSGNATAADILTGKTASVDSGDITGTMSDYGGLSRTGTFANATGSTNVYANIPFNGYYNTASTIQISDTDLIPANIKSGVNIFGVNGTVPRTATGTVTSSATTSTWSTASNGAYPAYSVTVTGLAFKPSYIIMVPTSANGVGFATIYVGSKTTYPVATRNNDGFANSAPLSVTTTGFVLPFDQASTSVTWYAFE